MNYYLEFGSSLPGGGYRAGVRVDELTTCGLRAHIRNMEPLICGDDVRLSDLGDTNSVTLGWLLLWNVTLIENSPFCYTKHVSQESIPWELRHRFYRHFASSPHPFDLEIVNSLEPISAKPV